MTEGTAFDKVIRKGLARLEANQVQLGSHCRIGAHMQGIWYGDRRDRVKWGALAFLAREIYLTSILQVAYFRESGQNVLKTHRGDVKIADAVWEHFTNLSGVEGLSPALCADIKVHGETFDPSNREQYLKGVLESVAACRQPRLVFLDPDTGIEPGTLKTEHASAQELERLWDTLTAGEVLAVYQHASFSPDWIAQSIKRMAGACRGALVRAIQGNVARDVAILWARKGITISATEDLPRMRPQI